MQHHSIGLLINLDMSLNIISVENTLLISHCRIPW